MSDPLPNDAPGEDCPDHGPYGDDDCPKCDFCGEAAHLLACSELIGYTERVKMGIQERAADALVTTRIISNVLHRIANPHPCRNCGDVTCADICAACSEWEGTAIIRGMVHQGMALTY